MNNIKEKHDAIELMLPVDPAYVSAARRTAASVSERMGFTTESVEDIKVAVSEACNYIIKHSWHTGAEHFHIVFAMTDEKMLSISLKTSFTQPTQELNEDDEEDDEDRMCFCVMQAFMNQLKISSDTKGIEIVMLKEKRRFHFIEGD